MAPLSGSRPDALIVIILILVILSGFIVAYYDHTTGESTYSTELSVNESKIVTTPLETTLQFTGDSGVIISLRDIQTQETNVTGLIPYEESDTVTLRSQEITVSFVQDKPDTDVVIEYELSSTYSWDNITVLFVSSVGVIVLGLFVYMILETLNFRGG